MMRASGLLGWSIVAGCLAVAPAWAPAQQSALGDFQGHGDVGQATRRGSVTYDAGRVCSWDTGTLALRASIDLHLGSQFRTMHVYVNSPRGWHVIFGQTTNLPPDVQQVL